MISYTFYNKIIYAHNGGRFDYLVLFGNLLAGEVIYSGARFISYKYKINKMEKTKLFF